METHGRVKKMLTMGQKEDLKKKMLQMMSKGMAGTCACGVRVKRGTDSQLYFGFCFTFPL